MKVRTNVYIECEREYDLNIVFTFEYDKDNNKIIPISKFPEKVDENIEELARQIAIKNKHLTIFDNEVKEDLTI